MEWYIPIIVAKVILLVLICVKYSESAYQPFTRSLYQFAFFGAVSKLLFFVPQAFGEPVFEEQIRLLFEDLSFIFPLIGVVVTMGLDFLWALSREGESPLFDNNISESDFTAQWYKLEIVFVVGLGAIRFFPGLFPIDVELVFQGAIQVVLYFSFGFIWFCLFKVRGTSTSPGFLRAYTIAWYVTFGCTLLVISNSIAAAPLIVSVKDNIAFFLFMQHCLETIGISLIVSYFMFFKAPPADLREHAKTAAAISGVVKSQSKFKALLGLHDKNADREREKLVEAFE
uniref:Uncharacterized protein n=1 Tax=Eutreptiella gymnastica TaxID=73025 RepID=A0A7S4GJG6_9EUGL